MHPYTGDPNNALVLGAQLPDDGVDKVKAQDVNPVFAALLDNDANLDATRFKKAGDYLLGDMIVDAAADIELPASSNIKIASLSSGEVRTRVARGHWLPLSSDWTMNARGQIVQATTSLSVGPVAIFEFVDIPGGVTITDVIVYVRGGAGHSGAGPAQMPKVEIQYLNVASDTLSTLTPVQDTWTNAATYEAIHSISVSSMALAWSAVLSKMLLVFTGEYGTVTFTGLTVIGIQIKYKQPGLDT